MFRRGRWGMLRVTRDERRRFFTPFVVAGAVVICFVVFGFSCFTTETGKESYSVNLYTAAIGILIAVSMIELLNRRRARNQLRAQLAREMGGQDKGLAFRAVKEMAANTWLFDGSLRGKDFQQAFLSGSVQHRANLKTADLQRADFRWSELEEVDFTCAKLQYVNFGDTRLQGAVFWCADLEGAQLNLAKMERANLGHANLRRTNLDEATVSDKQLIEAKQLRFAIMQDRKIYNGRYRLDGDIEDAKRENLNTDDPEVMAKFYNVSLEEYQDGQNWAKDNLSNLRGSP